MVNNERNTMTYKVGTKLKFVKNKVTFIQYSTRKANTRTILRTVKVN